MHGRSSTRAERSCGTTGVHGFELSTADSLSSERFELEARVIMRPSAQLFAFIAFACVAAASWAADVTRSDAQSVAEAAAAHLQKVGLKQAVNDFNSASEWKRKGVNVNLIDMQGNVLASSLNVRLRGKNTLEAQDPTGKVFTKEFISTARKGGGWVEYQFINPESKRLEHRAMYVRRAAHNTIVAIAISSSK